MDEYSSSQFEGPGATAKRRRSQTSRQPRHEMQWFPPSHDRFFLSPSPVSDDANKVSSNEANGNANSKGKVFNINQCSSRSSSISGAETVYPHKWTKKEDGGVIVSYGNGDMRGGINQGHDAPTRYYNTGIDGAENENKLKKVKLKVGGVTCTIQTKSSSNGSSGGGSSTRSARSSDTSQIRLKPAHQSNSDQDHSPDKKGVLQRNSSKDFLVGGFSRGMMPAKSAIKKQGDKSDPVRKSKRAPKRRASDTASDDEDDDDEIRYLAKLKSSKASGYKDFEEESSKKQPSISRFGKYENLEDAKRSSIDGRKSRSDRGMGDMDYEGEEMFSEGEPEGKKKKKKQKDISDFPPEIKKEMTLTTRQRALLTSKDASSATGRRQIEFPNGLPPPPPRKQKEKLSEEDQLLKKAEAAQRRRIQNEKAARESEAEAIRKILGQDASRKKREEQKKKRLEELAQEKAAHAQMLASNTVRWVMGPTGTVVTFPQDMGLPQIFYSKPCTYPRQREKCAGPSCTNLYKYRDSKSKLPLCSLQCYKAIREKMEGEMAC